MDETTHRTIAIDIATRYLDEQSKPDEDLYYFAYTIGIGNTGNVPSQLISRRWLIVDALGFPREVVGDGVVGEQPRLRPGERFEYTSSTFFQKAGALGASGSTAPTPTMATARAAVSLLFIAYP